MPTLSDRLIPHLRRATLLRDAAPLTDGQLLGAFLADRDPAAFECLVRRHGPMVFGVCRRVIGHAHTAEDAFQAVFVVLARKAGAVRPREQLANWLFGVAYRTALKARALLCRRRTREKQVEVMPDVSAPDAPDTWADLQPVLDAELAALPDHLRLPVVLCDLEGRTQREAARHLGLPPATLANRLAAARRRLAERLAARGIALSGGLLATLVGSNATAAVPAGLCAAAAKVGLTAIGVTAGVVPESVLQLSEGVLRMMMLTKLKAVTAAALAGLLLLGGFGASSLPRAFAQDGPTGQPAAKPALGPNLSDAEFLKRMCDTLRGTPATAAELGYFVADTDGHKRKKAVGWLTEEAATKTNIDAVILHRHGGAWLDAGSSDLELRRLSLGLTDQLDAVHVWKGVMADPQRIAFSPDGTKIAAADEKNEIVVVYDADAPKSDEGKAQPTKTGERIIVLDKSGAEGQPKADPKARDRIIRLRADVKDAKEQPRQMEVQFHTLRDFNAHVPGTTDADFLNKATAEARGGAPTKLEREYFLADKDPKKREKLLDLLLSDPAVAKTVGPDWKKNMLNPPQPLRAVFVLAGGADWSKLIGELQAAKKTDEQILECLALAITGRLPTDLEKKLVAGQVAKEKDKKAAWAGVAATLAGTDEAKKHAEKLKPQDHLIHFRVTDMAPTPEIKVVPLPKK